MAEQFYFERVGQQTPTQFFCDSPDAVLLRRAVAWGAVGATANPPRAARAIRADPEYWREQVCRMIETRPALPDEDLADLLTQAVVKRASELLLPIYKQSNGEKGYQAIQGSPREYANTEVLISSAVGYSTIAPNVAVKIPVHAEGLEAIEELAARGINLIATTGYSVAQCIAAAEAHFRGVNRAGDVEPVSRFIVTMVSGHLDAHFADRIAHEKLDLPQTIVDQAGMAVAKKIYRAFQERRLPSMLLVAGTRKHRHFTDFVGGKMGVTVSPPLQEEIVKADPAVVSRIDEFPSPEEIDWLRGNLPDFRRAYDDDGLTVEEMRDFAPCVKLETYFREGFDDILEFVKSCRS